MPLPTEVTSGEAVQQTTRLIASEVVVEHPKFSPWGSFRGEVRALEDDDGPIVEGYAAVFERLSQVIEWGYRERIMPGAFTQTIKNGDVRALFNHDADHVLGRMSAGTLTLREDAVGLWYQARPDPEATWVRDLVRLIQRGEVKESSFAFQPVKEDWSPQDKIRTLREVRLFDVSPVTWPAYLDTIVQARSLAIADLIRGNPEPGNHSENVTPAPIEADPGNQSAAEPAESHSEVQIRPLSVLVREHRIERERGQ